MLVHKRFFESFVSQNPDKSGHKSTKSSESFLIERTVGDSQYSIHICFQWLTLKNIDYLHQWYSCTNWWHDPLHVGEKWISVPLLSLSLCSTWCCNPFKRNYFLVFCFWLDVIVFSVTCSCECLFSDMETLPSTIPKFGFHDVNARFWWLLPSVRTS